MSGSLRTEAEMTSADLNSSAVKPLNSFRQYRAPRDHGQSLIEPSMNRVGDLIRINSERAIGYGPLFSSLRARARRQLIEDAVRYTSAYRDVRWVEESMGASLEVGRPILMAGHQPAIFHPGVWFKNFALDHLAKSWGGIAVNLIIDNDVSSRSSVRVPSINLDTGQPQYRAVPYDVAGGGVPYEQTTIRDRKIFDRFGDSVAVAVSGLVDDPCVNRLWKHAVAAVERCGVAGCALAQARHGLEDELGLQTLELPLGVACRGSAFAEFLLSILTELPRFQACYNDSADYYRREHGIRSTAHPVPNLGQVDDWFEAPLWIYGNDSPERNAAWVRLSDDELVISDQPTTENRSRRELRVNIRHPKLASEQLANSVSPNFKLRPRALVTTMYARLVLSDLFLHGIGGGKYDQLGDLVMRDFFSVDPPEFMVVSATIQLPGLERIDFEQQIRSIRRQLRDTVYQPERFADQVEFEAGLLEKKRMLLSRAPVMKNKKAWHDDLTEVNQSLSVSLEPLRGEMQRKLSSLNRSAAAQKMMASREHPFCVYPLEYLTETYAALLA